MLDGAPAVCLGKGPQTPLTPPGFAIIHIDIPPTYVHLSSATLGWHGLMSAIAVMAGVLVGVRMAQTRGFSMDDAYPVVLAGVLCAVVGSRLMYVLDNWGRFGSDPLRILRFDEGGLSILGGLLGGVIGGLAIAIPRRIALRPGLDAAAFGLPLGMGIGRIGCLILGDYVGAPSQLPWAVVYTNHESPAFGLAAMHPEVAYEIIGDLVIFSALFALARVYRRDGLLFFTFLLAYSLMRFVLNFLREDYSSLGPLDSNQVIFTALMAVSAIGLAVCARGAPGEVRRG